MFNRSFIPGKIEKSLFDFDDNHLVSHSEKSHTMRESNPAWVVCKAHYV